MIRGEIFPAEPCQAHLIGFMECAKPGRHKVAGDKKVCAQHWAMRRRARRA